MINQAFLQGLSEQLGQLVNKASASGMAGDSNLQDQIQGVLQGAFSKMNLVNREEFDAQAAVLKRTRERLEALEAQIAALDEALSASDQQADQ